MLSEMFPRHVIEYFGVHGTGAVPQAMSLLANRHNAITIFFMDIVGFTPLAKEADPQDVMKMLNELFSVFDALCGWCA
jgi:class 3 adenylate cyclase